MLADNVYIIKKAIVSPNGNKHLFRDFKKMEAELVHHKQSLDATIFLYEAQFKLLKQWKSLW